MERRSRAIRNQREARCRPEAALRFAPIRGEEVEKPFSFGPSLKSSVTPLSFLPAPLAALGLLALRVLQELAIHPDDVALPAVGCDRRLGEVGGVSNLVLPLSLSLEGETMRSQDAKEAQRAFVEKRPPTFGMR